VIAHCFCTPRLEVIAPFWVARRKDTKKSATSKQIADFFHFYFSEGDGSAVS